MPMASSTNPRWVRSPSVSVKECVALAVKAQLREKAASAVRQAALKVNVRLRVPRETAPGHARRVEIVQHLPKVSAQVVQVKAAQV